MLNAAVKQSRHANRRPRRTRSGTALPRSDGRTIASRRFRQLVEEFERELGGELSEADRSLIKQAANLVQVSERLQADVIAGVPVDADALVRISSEARRILGMLKAKAAKSQPPAPTIHDLVAELEADDSEGVAS
jgi:hypothetical protein